MRKGLRSRSQQVVLGLFAAVVVACGPSGSPPLGPSATPLATATALAPTPTIAPTPTVVAAVAAMALGERGRATSVNAEQWISVVADSVSSVIGIDARLVLPPDAGADAEPLPLLPCQAAPPEECFHQFDVPLQVGEDGWIYGFRVFFGSGGPFTPLPAAFGPDGAFSLLFDVEVPPLPLDDLLELEIRMCRGPRFVGDAILRSGQGTRHVPLLWPGPSPEAVILPGDEDGPIPTDCDAAGRISGAGVAPFAPAVWLPAGDGPEGWVAEAVLDPLPGHESAAPLAISGDLVVGWSGTAEDPVPVAWRLP